MGRFFWGGYRGKATRAQEIPGSGELDGRRGAQRTARPTSGKEWLTVGINHTRAGLVAVMATVAGR